MHNWISAKLPLSDTVDDSLVKYFSLQEENPNGHKPRGYKMISNHQTSSAVFDSVYEVFEIVSPNMAQCIMTHFWGHLKVILQILAVISRSFENEDSFFCQPFHASLNLECSCWEVLHHWRLPAGLNVSLLWIICLTVKWWFPKCWEMALQLIREWWAATVAFIPSWVMTFRSAESSKPGN